MIDYGWRMVTNVPIRMHFLQGLVPWDSISFLCWSSIFCMSSNSGFGKQFSFIYCEYWTPLKGVHSLILTASEDMNHIDVRDIELKTLNSYRQVPTFGHDTIQRF